MFIMKYNFNSEKFRKRRKARFKSQTKFIEALNEKGCKIGRNSISDLENGKIPDDLSLNNIVAFCEVLECDLEHLLDISDYSTQEVKTICEYTGLSEATVDLMHLDTPWGDTHYLGKMISEFCDTYQEFPELLMQISTYCATRKSMEARDKALQKIPWRERDYKQIEEQVEANKKVDGELFACMSRIQEMYDAAKYSSID